MDFNLTENSGQQAAAAVAHANIALIKYWGKRNTEKNLPAVGSISLTLNALKTETSVRFDESLPQDRFRLNENMISGKPLARVDYFLDIACGLNRPKALVESENNFPASAGLASSASGFAALALAAAEASGQKLNKRELSRLARRGSGSAARSIYGGFVEMKCGNNETDDEDYAAGLFDENYWDVRMLVAVTSTRVKAVGSTEGMNRTAKTSPFYQQWIERQPRDLDEMRDAVRQKNFEKVGELTEHSCFKMHALAMSAKPPLLYWNDTTVKIIHMIQNMRKAGTAAYITADAGPQVKILCLPDVIDEVKQALKTVSGIKRVIECKPGPGASVKTLEKV